MIDQGDFLANANVSRETLARLESYARQLTIWNKRINLVSPKSLDDLWQRHFLDSLQLLRVAPPWATWVDLGSGGGFPGAVVAIANPDRQVTLMESDARKCAFLRTIARETTGFQVVNERIEDAEPQSADVVSARALAPLDKLLTYASRHLDPNGRAVFLKGRKAREEIEVALENWRFDCETFPSETDEEAVILSIGDIERV
ncbi:MAG: 16S rRNA (guanine(527)-N(7))-methyltransferase RsmG [Silicimonas sp.]|nr:16S rRNA (guanine(527)-N(7))-methyltransferase RsmG [Silicimonas sp.]